MKHLLRWIRPLSAVVLAALIAVACQWGGRQSELQAQASSAAKKPNILFIFTDDHGWQAISAYGSNRNTTPNIDRLAQEGMLFHNCLVTNSICGPSRAVIQTGKHSHLNGFYRNGLKFNGDQQTFPKILQTKGYQTAIIGKWHLESVPQGFDHFDVLLGQGPYYNPPMQTTDENGKVIVRKHTGYTTDIITDKSLDWLKSRDPNKPFMLMYQHKAPHRDWQPAPRYLHKYDDVQIPEPATLFDDYAGRGAPAHTQDMTIAKTMTARDLKLTQPGNFTPEQLAAWNAAYEPKNEAFRKANPQGDDLVRWKYQRYVKDYLRCVDAVDENIGRVLKYLDDNGLADNTVVIYSSDQGWYLGEHGWFDKRWMYEESLKTPLLVRWPGVIKAGSENHDMVSNLDFAETFLDLAGAPIPGDMQGQSLVPLFKGKTPESWRQSFYYHYYEFPGAHSVRKHYGVRTTTHKLIHFYEPEINEWELYDLQKDPDEMKSVYGDPAYADVEKALKTELERLREHYQVPDQDPTPPKRKK